MHDKTLPIFEATSPHPVACTGQALSYQRGVQLLRSPAPAPSLAGIGGETKRRLLAFFTSNTLDNPALFHKKLSFIHFIVSSFIMAKLTTRAQDYSERYNQLAGELAETSAVR